MASTRANFDDVFSYAVQAIEKMISGVATNDHKSSAAELDGARPLRGYAKDKSDLAALVTLADKLEESASAQLRVIEDKGTADATSARFSTDLSAFRQAAIKVSRGA